MLQFIQQPVRQFGQFRITCPEILHKERLKWLLLTFRSSQYLCIIADTDQDRKLPWRQSSGKIVAEREFPAHHATGKIEQYIKSSMESGEPTGAGHMISKPT